MPWKMGDATSFTKKAKSPKQKEKWSKIANAVLGKSGDDGKAIRIANAMVKKGRKKSTKPKGKK